MNLRPELARHLDQRLGAFREGFRHNLALLGPPGSGKTYQLAELTSRHAHQDLLIISVSLYRESCRSFLQRFCAAILRAGLSAGLPADQDPTAGMPLDQLLSAADAVLPKTAAAIRQADQLIARRLYGDAFTRTLDAIPVLKEESRRACVLILDEFLFLETIGLGHAFHELGKRVMTWPSTLFILTSSSLFRARTILRERLQLLFGQFELLTLEGVDPQETLAWLQREFRGLRGLDTVAPFLVQWLGAQPWYLSAFVRRLKELIALHRSHQMDAGLFLGAAWDLLGSGEGMLHQWCVSRLEGLTHDRAGARAVDALIAVAEGARTTSSIGQRIGRAGLPAALQMATERDLAERNGTCWLVPDPALRCWLSTVALAQRDTAGLDQRELRRRFDQHVQGLWDQWMQANQLTFSEQVVRLFGRFQDDTVSLDSKTGRLPAFDAVNTHPGDPAQGGMYVVADAQGKRWCATVQEQAVGETVIAQFEAFCRTQAPKPTRKVVIMNSSMDPNARLLAKAANMWVWEAAEIKRLLELYGRV